MPFGVSRVHPVLLENSGLGQHLPYVAEAVSWRTTVLDLTAILLLFSSQ